MRKRSSDGALQPFFYAEEVTSPDYSTTNELFFQNFTKTFEFDKEYLILIELDKANSTLIGTFDGEQIIYDIASPIYPVPYDDYVGLQTRMDSGPGTVVATVDDVKVKIESPFQDAASFSYQQYIQILSDNNIPQGCDDTGTFFCPNQLVPRDLSSIWLLKAIEGNGYMPPAATDTTYDDITVDSYAADFIEQLAARGITEGCSLIPALFCPKMVLTKRQSAMLLLKAKNGNIVTPPPATGTVFNDVGATDFGAGWIEELYNQGYADGCDPDNFCPDSTVTMVGFAKMLTKTFGL